MNIYFNEPVIAEGDWFSPEEGTTFDLKSCYNVDLSEIFSKLVIAAEGLSFPRKELFDIFNTIKSYIEEKHVNRKMIIALSEREAVMSDYDESLLRCDFSNCKAVFYLEMAAVNDGARIVVMLKSIDLYKHIKARFIANELTALCKKVNDNIKSLEYFFTEKTDEEKRFVKGEEYCVVTFGYFTRNVLITADSLSAITIDVLNKI